VVLSINPMIERLGSVVAALVTGTGGPAVTHIALGAECGLTEYDESYVNAADLHQLPKGQLQRRRGRLAPAELASVERAVRTCLGM
jgi:mRNA interferase MazF